MERTVSAASLHLLLSSSSVTTWLGSSDAAHSKNCEDKSNSATIRIDCKKQERMRLQPQQTHRNGLIALALWHVELPAFHGITSKGPRITHRRKLQTIQYNTSHNSSNYEPASLRRRLASLLKQRSGSFSCLKPLWPL